jgi:AraC-like DNA-binding protein
VAGCCPFIREWLLRASGAKKEKMDIIQFLSKLDPYRKLTPVHLALISRSYQREILPPGAMLIEQGRPVWRLGIIQSGVANIAVVDYVGHKLVCGILRPGDHFFDVAVLSGAVATASVVCIEQTTCLVQDRQGFIQSIEACRPLKSFFYQKAAQGIRSGYECFCGRQMRLFPPAQDSAPILPFIRKAIDYLEEHYHRPITLAMVARESGMSKFHFSRLFKQHMGISFKQYLNLKRIEAAKVLISQHGHNVTEAGFAVGFNDASYFSRVFRELEGRSPKCYTAEGDRFASKIVNQR